MLTLAGESREQFLNFAEKVMARFIDLPENPDKERKGGYLTVLKGGKKIMVIELGNGNPAKTDKYFTLCQEKAERLFAHAADGHISSWQSRDSENSQFGGGIAVPNNSGGKPAGKQMIGAISGLSEHGDEAVTAVIWCIFRWAVLEDARKIIHISENPFIIPLIKACNDLYDAVN